MTLTVCNHPGCPELTTTTHCTTHTHGRRQAADQRRGTATQRGYNTRWQHTRRHYLRHHPLCENEDCGAIATVVHHLDGQGPNGPHGHNPANLQALCKRCHDRLTAQDHGGWQRARA